MVIVAMGAIRGGVLTFTLYYFTSHVNFINRINDDILKSLGTCCARHSRSYYPHVIDDTLRLREVK
jgi:hypothetical protein